MKDIIKKEPVSINSLLELIRQIDLEIIEVMKATKDYKWNPYEDSRAILKVNIHENVLMATFSLSMLAETINIYNQKEWWAKRLPHLKKQFESDKYSSTDNNFNYLVNRFTNNFKYNVG